MNLISHLSLQLIWPAAIFLMVMLELWLAVRTRKPVRQVVRRSRKYRS